MPVKTRNMAKSRLQDRKNFKEPLISTGLTFSPNSATVAHEPSDQVVEGTVMSAPPAPALPDEPALPLEVLEPQNDVEALASEIVSNSLVLIQHETQNTTDDHENSLNVNELVGKDEAAVVATESKSPRTEETEEESTGIGRLSESNPNGKWHLFVLSH